MKKVQKVLAWLLVFMMLFTGTGMNVAAEEVVVETEEHAENVEAKPGADVALEEIDTQQQQISDETENPEVTQQESSEGSLEYVYVDENVVNVPQTQNIAVGFVDETLKLESAVLHYSSVVTGEQLEMQASAIVNNTVLFTQDYPEGSAEDVYQLDSITYQSAGVTSTVSLMEEEIDAGYTVTARQEQEAASEEMPDVSVYSLNEEGAAIEASADVEDIEETVAGVLGEADSVSPFA